MNQSEAETVREIFRRYLALGSVRQLMEELNRRGIRSKVRVAKNGKTSGGNSFFRGPLYVLLSNPIYIGEIRHKGIRHPGLHEPIVERELWEKTQLLLRSQAVRGGSRTKAVASPLMGRLFDESDQSLTSSHAMKGERRYRYYVSRSLIKGTADSDGRGWRWPAPEVERTVAASACQILSDRTGIARRLSASQRLDFQRSSRPQKGGESACNQKVEAGAALSALVDRVDLSETGIRLSLKVQTLAQSSVKS